MFCYYGYMITPVVISQTSLSRAVEHAVSDVDAVRTGVRAAGVSDREVLEVLEVMLSLQRQVNGTVSVLMAVAEQRNAALGTANTPLESVLAASGQESVRQVRNQVFRRRCWRAGRGCTRRLRRGGSRWVRPGRSAMSWRVCRTRWLSPR